MSRSPSAGDPWWASAQPAIAARASVPIVLPDLDDDTRYRGLAARDPRFDGRFVVGVTTTGVYCRPICRVRTPLQRNCRFFETPAQAEAASFRPCLKCRPEIAPGAGLPWSVMDASRTLARCTTAIVGASASTAPRSAQSMAAVKHLGDRRLCQDRGTTTTKEIP